MSDIAPAVATCPRCGLDQPATLFTSVNADEIPAQHAAILDGTFEERACEGCGHPFRPEHRLLYTQASAQAWIVVYPLAERRAFGQIERVVGEVLDRELAAAPPVAQRALRAVRRRLVFGQHMLSEAARLLHAGVDPALLECAKLFAARQALPHLMPLGPFELCFERFGEAGALVCGVHRLGDGQRADVMTLPAEALAEVRGMQPELERLYPELFTRPYVSASRYLYGALV